MEEKLWLRPENETPFEFHRDSTIDEREKRIFENRKTICSYAVKEGLDSIKSVEDADMLLTGINAMAVENPEARKQIPPFKTLEQEQISFVNNYLTAQKLFFEKVDKEPYIYPELLQMVHACLTRDNLDLADYEKGRYRNQYSGIIQIGYFEPTKGEKVGYNSKFTAEEPTKLATISIGYADGLSFASSRNGFRVIIKGHKCPVVGNVCMDNTIVKIPFDSDIKEGDIATIFGYIDDEDKHMNHGEFLTKSGAPIGETFARLGARIIRICHY